MTIQVSAQFARVADGGVEVAMDRTPAGGGRRAVRLPTTPRQGSGAESSTGRARRAPLTHAVEREVLKCTHPDISNTNKVSKTPVRG